MGRPEKEGSCKKHPFHKHSSGVCPFCLRDRLANFSSSSSSSTNNAASSIDSSSDYSFSYDSEISSLNASPPHEDLNDKNILKLFKSGRMEMLRKNKSVTFYKEGERGKEEDDKKKKNKGKKGRFWTKLMMGGERRRKQMEAGLSHSKTMKEKSSYKWIFFS